MKNFFGFSKISGVLKYTSALTLRAARKNENSVALWFEPSSHKIENEELLFSELFRFELHATEYRFLGFLIKRKTFALCKLLDVADANTPVEYALVEGRGDDYLEAFGSFIENLSKVAKTLNFVEDVLIYWADLSLIAHRSSDHLERNVTLMINILSELDKSVEELKQ